MKNYSFFLTLIFSLSLLSFTNSAVISQDKPQIGDVLIISKNNINNYKYIKFPRLNILHKRGAIGNYDRVQGTEVEITEITENKYGKVNVKLVRTDGKKFFNKIKSVTAIYHKAIESGELIIKLKS